MSTNTGQLQHDASPKLQRSMLTPIIFRRRELLWLALVLILFSHPLVRAQQEKIAFKHLTIDDGLSQNAVLAILQDRQGFMWLGTKDGLNRYDGYSFTVYQHNPFDSTSLSANYITALFEDSRGGIWIGTVDGGLNRLQRETGSFQRLRNLSSHSQNFSAQEITTIAEDSTGAMWIGTRGDGLLRFFFVRYSSFRRRGMHAICSRARKKKQPNRA